MVADHEVATCHVDGGGGNNRHDCKHRGFYVDGAGQCRCECKSHIAVGVDCVRIESTMQNCGIRVGEDGCVDLGMLESKRENY